jgi:hypothetical protein
MKNIQINQQEVSFGKQFEVSINGKVRHTVDAFPNNTYLCQADANIYELFEHPGLKFSIYRNDYQTAYARRERYSFLQGDSYHISVSDNEDCMLIIALFICIDDYRGNDNTMFRVNMGIVNEAIPYSEDI